jgi:TolB-like protein
MPGSNANRYRLTLLGPFGLQGPDGLRIEISSKKGMALIALLAMASEGERSRVWLQTKLWGSRGSAQAQASLRREISNLKQALGEAHKGLLDTGHSRVALDLRQIDIDAREIEARLKTFPDSAMLAFGEFLEGMDLAGEEEFEDWLRIQRDLIGALAEKEKRTALRLDADDVNTIAATLLAAPLEADGRAGTQWTVKGALKLPNRPSIGVMPFTNLSSGSAPDEFADGIVEEISFSLARYSTLFVISSGSTLAYRDPTLDMAVVCDDLGVRYLLRGSVRLSSTRVRVTVMLIDGIANEQIWTDKFEDSVDDIFDLQDRVAYAVAVLIDSNIEKAEMKRASMRPITSPDTYQLYYRANAALRRADKQSILEAIELTEQVLSLEPDNSWAAALGGFCHASVFQFGWADDPASTREAAVTLYERSLRFGNEDPVVLGFGAGTLVQTVGDLKVADLLVERSLAIIPGYASSLFWGGWVDVATGAAERALERLQLSLRLNPRSTVRPFTQTALGLALIGLQRFDEAALVLGEAIALAPHYPATNAGLAVALYRTGQREDARNFAQRLDRVGGIAATLSFIQNADVRGQLANDLAGALAA